MSAKDDFEALTDWAERLGLDEGQSENFITSSMRRLGHTPSVLWNDAQESGDEGGGGVADFFGGGKRREQRQVRGQQGQSEPPRRRAGGGGWQYGE